VIKLYSDTVEIYDTADTLSDTYTLYCLESDMVTSGYAEKYNRNIIYLHSKDLCVFNTQSITPAAIKEYGTCALQTVYYLSCECGRVGNADTFAGDHAPHVFSKKSITDAYKISNATCTSKAIYNYCCEVCKAKGSLTFKYGETLPHSFTKQNVSDEYKVKDASCTSRALYNYCCETCEAKGENTFEYGEHSHILSEAWYYGTEYHFRKCMLCKETGEIAEHIYDENNSCKTCSYTLGSDISVFGNVTSYGKDTDSITLELIPAGENAAAYSTVLTGNETEFSFDAVNPGEYTLRISKTKHTAREYSVSTSKNTELCGLEIRLCGDVNGDGTINASDATQIKRYYNNKTSVFTAKGTDTEYLKKVADVNNDGSANASDSTQIKRYYNNKTSVFINLP